MYNSLQYISPICTVQVPGPLNTYFPAKNCYTLFYSWLTHFLSHLCNASLLVSCR